MESAVLFGPSGEIESLPSHDVEEKYSKTRRQSLKLMDVRVAVCFVSFFHLTLLLQLEIDKDSSLESFLLQIIS